MGGIRGVAEMVFAPAMEPDILERKHPPVPGLYHHPQKPPVDDRNRPRLVPQRGFYPPAFGSTAFRWSA